MFFRPPHKKHVFVAVWLTLALTLMAWPAQGASESAALERTKQELSEIRKRIAAAKGRANSIEKEVGALDAQISSLTRQIRKGEHDISSLESEIRTAQVKIGEMEAAYERASKASNDRARRLYKTGPTQALDRFLSSKSLLEFIRLQVFWEISSELDGKTMLDSARLKADLSEQRSDLEAIKGSLSAQKRWLQERQALIASARKEKATALASVQAEIAAHEKHARELEAESRRLTAALKSSNLSRSSGAVSRSGFIWPLNGRVTSEYGRRGGGFHVGMDIDGNTGDAIKASKAGNVASISCGSGYGICTIIDHGNGVTTLYAHMSRKAISGGRVETGQVIGYVGCTGSCTGSHLHFETRVNGDPQNPRNFLP